LSAAGLPDRVRRGRSFPLGVRLDPHGANFSVYSTGTRVDLVLFDAIDDPRPARVIELDPAAHHTWRYWHAFVPGVRAGQAYGYRVHGPFAAAEGRRFDGTKLLLDPYARAVSIPAARSRRADHAPGDNTATAMRSVIADLSAYDWEGDHLPRTPFSKTVIYEMHVGHFTRHPSSGVPPARRGTFAGVIDKIPYLKDLGVTAVELMPVFAFDRQSAPAGLGNAWGYEPISFFAPHPSYSSRSGPLGALDEFRDMVKALHRAGLEVILDVVYNHTGEDGADGPTLGLRGLANEIYYIVNPDGSYADYSGCGNSLDANEAVVRRLIVDSLRYWVGEMHVDGFRFDLAAVLSRDRHGVPIPSPPVLRDIESDPVLANVKLIAEAWDARGLYQVGLFGSQGWKEWNGSFRDDVRRFVKGDERSVGALASRLAGSPDIYRSPTEDSPGINFVTCHDGFTLNDLVSYNGKHNEANGESNRDGPEDNHSWNCGAEGPTEDPGILALRTRQAKNLLTLTLLSAGTPMLLMGDELRRTQRGNNNPYCLDDERVWLDWSRADENADLHRFVRGLIALRLGAAGARGTSDLHAAPGVLGAAGLSWTPRRVSWHGIALGRPDFSDASHSLAATVHCDGATMHIVLNAYWERLSFELPVPAAGEWRCVIDTFQASPHDIDLAGTPVRAGSVVAEPRSTLVLLSAPGSL
jgi:isoamylase